ncbi:chorion class CA protein ERA.1-like [Helicoverpa zea]|uniref:chorion class CA protein ERA.1-like n=1 Tax=Helicoverpa zea TaxID=7113 RepID=UPI001F58876A|nr:chorion class CA protein ERA.1-like [Helicoverpa zea]
MSTFAVLLLCIQACLVQHVFGQYIGNSCGCGGAGAIAPAAYSRLGATPGCGNTLGLGSYGGAIGSGYGGALGNGAYGGALGPAGYGAIGSGAAYGGTGEGNVAVYGELPVGGNTAIAGTVPIMGAVRFAGPVAAAGAVSITGQCACGCGAPIAAPVYC